MIEIPHSLPPDYRLQLERYAELIVKHGLNVQPGQIVAISSEVFHRELLHLLTEQMYRQGASYVHVDLADPLLQRVRYVHSRNEYLERVPTFFEARFRELVDTSGGNLKILGPEFPDYLSDIDPDAINKVRKANYDVAKLFYAEGIGKSRVHWCVVAASTPAWAQRIFPNLSPLAAELRLWEEIFKICRVDKENFLELWKAHNDLLMRRSKRLTDMKIESLRFTGPGTDLVVGLSTEAVFRGGSDLSPRGVEFEPNIPTEECFTTPDLRRTSGRVSATRPFLVNGQLIRGLNMEFEAGQLVRFDCQEGRAALESYIGSDSGARFLGEVALVGTDSPVFQSGLVFEEILFDENAACHIALGSAYKGCLRNGSTLSDEECERLGCNVSSVHTDIMISSEHVDVVAQLHSREELKIIEKGRWAAGF